MIGRWHDKKPSKALGIKADNVSAASVGKEKETAPETRRSGESVVGVYGPTTTSRWTRDINPPLAKILAVKLVPEPKKVRPVRLMAPLPLAITLDPFAAA